MSGPLAIAAVTAVLKDLLNDGLLNHDLSTVGSFSVTASPPDRITVGATEPNRLNLFLYQVTPNQGWRNEGLPARDGNGARLTNPPLALDLHYLLTAYGSQDLNAEILLGFAMQLLHETPMLTRAQLRTVLGGVSPVDGSIIPSIFGNLSAADLADQVELIKITPVTLSTEDLSKMWTAMQARYRPTMAYVVSVVLIQATNPIRAAAPVLKRGPDDRGPEAVGAPFPTLLGVKSGVSELMPAIRLGDDMVLSGNNLGPAQRVMMTHMTADVENEITPTTGPRGTLTARVPDIAADPNAMNLWAVGMYAVAVRETRPGLPAWTSNSVPVGLAPLITVNPTASAPGNITLTVSCTPRLRPDQVPHAVLLFGSESIAPTTIDTPGDLLQPSTLTFDVPAVAAGTYLVRLRVQGIDSVPVTVASPPARFDFDPLQMVNVA